MTAIAAHASSFPVASDLFGATPSWLRTLLQPLTAWSTRLVRQGRVTSVDPQDFAQEAICRMVAAYGEAKLAETPAPVLRAIAWRALRNMVVDESRKKGRTPVREPVSDIIDPAPAIDALVVQQQSSDRLQVALATLASEERAFVMAVMQLDSVPAAQKQVGWPKRSPYYQLKLIFERLRTAMEASDPH